jgi:hypothetical protein
MIPIIPREVPRRVATLLLRFAICIAPRNTHDWGRAMLSELNHVEGNWAALIWAIGGAGVLVKHAMLAVILPGSHRPTVTSANELFAKERPMRKTTLVAIAASTVASLLFFLAPVFRQAFRVSLAQWHDVLHVGSPFGEQPSDAALEALAQKARQNRDPEALAFAAVRRCDQKNNARLADEAVRLDPNLTWIYAIVAVECPWRPEIDSWIPELEKWDSENALPYLITAEEIDIDQVVREKIPHRADEEPPAWQAAMARAFRSSKLDTYSRRLRELDRRVLLRYRIDDPFEALEGDSWYGLPSYGAQDASCYAEWLIEAGGSLEARGDPKGAREKYWAVARFGQMLGSRGGFFVSRERKEAYQRLGTLSEMDGNKREATFYASLRDQLDREAEEERASWGSRFPGSSVSHWNAFLVRLAGLSMLVSGLLLLACAVGVLVRTRSVRWPSLRPSPLTLALAFASALGALLSSAVLFVSYWPYSELLQRFLRNGDDVGLSELSGFLGDARLPLGSQFNLGPGSWYVASWDAVFYFWLALTILCVLGLLIAVVRHLETRPRPRAG